jgi:hypothetical protein
MLTYVCFLTAVAPRAVYDATKPRVSFILHAFADIFCVECANEIFSTTTLICAACDTTLDQPDDVVVLIPIIIWPVVVLSHPITDMLTPPHERLQNCAAQHVLFCSMAWADEVMQ